jgi:hypothetical protein
MASGHVSRIKRPNTWLHRPMLQNVKKLLPTRSRPHMALNGRNQPSCRCRSSRYSGHHDPAGRHPTPGCRATRVTLAPADDGAFSENRYPAIGSMLVTVTNWFDDPASRVNAVGDDETGDG